MTDYDFSSFLRSPLSLIALVAIVVAAVMAWRLLYRQWGRHRVNDTTRSRETATLVFATLAALLAVVVVHAHLDKQDRDIRMLAELAQKEALAGDLQTRITAEVDRVRQLLADRTVRHIEQQQLTQARTELARFQSLKDPRITQMLVLIDTELEIRALVAQSLDETAPDALLRIYTRLTELVPDHLQYRENAERYSAEVKAAANGDGATAPGKP